MNHLVFVVLGILDVIALFALMFRIFRLPFFAYIIEIGIIALFVTIISFLFRVYFKIDAVFDIISHAILYVVFTRYIIKVRWWRSFIIVLTGYFSYGLISFLLYTIYMKTGIVSQSSLEDSTTSASYIIQITQISTASIVAFVLYKMGLGFSFIIRPPHNFYIKEVVTGKDLKLIITIAICGCLFFTGFNLAFKHQVFEVVPLVLIGYIILMYLAHRRDMKR